MERDKIITVKDQQGQVLKSFTYEERDQAFDYLKELEQWGVEGTLHEPSLPETLIRALGASEQDSINLQAEIDEEIADHESDSCTFSSGSPKIPEAE
jgi:hypothetical protein